jgi:DNA-binding CsgD family transcriptional regulator
MASNRSGWNNRRHFAIGSSKHLTPRDSAEERTVTVADVILEGRRYRLVPVDETPALQPRPDTRLLTGRELQIVSLVAEGRINKQIADELHISEWTVSTHLRRIFVKLGVDTRAAMVGKCVQALGRLSHH